MYEKNHQLFIFVFRGPSYQWHNQSFGLGYLRDGPMYDYNTCSSSNICCEYPSQIGFALSILSNGLKKHVEIHSALHLLFLLFG